MSEAKNAGNSV